MSATTEAAAAPHRRGQTRARIEDTAERLFRTMGYQKTAVADIARELGMSPANVYRFFPSKSAINEAIAERMLGGMRGGDRGHRRGPRAAAGPPAPPLLRALHQRQLGCSSPNAGCTTWSPPPWQEHWGVVERYIQACIGRHPPRASMDGMAAGVFARRRRRADGAPRCKQAIVAFIHPALIAECLGQTRPDAEELRGRAGPR